MEIAATSKIALLGILLYCPLAAQNKNQEIRWVTREQGLSQSTVNAILKDHMGYMWFGTETGLNQYDGYRMIVYKNRSNDPNSIDGNYINALFEDSKKNLWVGTGHGLNRFDRDKRTFIRYPMAFDLNKESGGRGVGSFFEGKDNQLWMNTERGIHCLDRNSDRFIHIQPSPNPTGGFSYSMVNRAAETRSGLPDRAWVVFRAFLYELDSKKQTIKLYENQTLNALGLPVSDIAFDPEGRLWISSTHNLLRLDPATNEVTQVHISWEPKLSLKRVLPDRFGRVWLGTDQGLFYLVKDSGEVWPLDEDAQGIDAHSAKMVLTLFIDNQNQLWAGTDGGGIFYINLSSPSLQASRIGQEDSPPIPATESGFPESKPKISSTATQNHGSKNQPPPVVLTDFLLFNKSANPGSNQRRGTNQPITLTHAIDQAESLTLSHRESVLSFEFAALDYADPESNAYAYRLNGFDKDWIYTDADRRLATYTNLDPGFYQFQVRAANKDGVWNEEGLHLDFRVHPPLWRSSWAYGFYISIAAIIVLTAFRTMRQKLELERKKVTQLKRVDKIKDLFLAKTSHELRTPLYGMIGLAESLRDDPKDHLSGRAQGTLTTIASCGQRMSHLISDISDYSILRTGNLELKKTRVDLHALTDIIFTISRPMIGKKDLMLVNAIDPRLPLVAADESRILQVLQNLVGNAIRFSDSGKIRVTAQEEPPWVKLQVEDSGIGISKEDQQFLFQPYQQALSWPEGQRKSEGGMGLGLWITRQILELHGGGIAVKSSQGTGSVFTFWLPQDAKVIPAKEPQVSRVPNLSNWAGTNHTVSLLPTAKANPGNSAHILVVDDEAVNRRVLTGQLEGANYKVTCVSSGEQALAALEKGKFDLVLLDITMPVMSGFEVCRLARGMFSQDELPILFLTARDQTGDREQGYQLGGNDFLTKPVPRGKLLARVKIQIDLLAARRKLDMLIEERIREISHKACELREQAGNLREQEAMKNRFLANLSQELRGPLTMMMAPFHQPLEDEDQASAPDPQWKLLQRQTASLSNLVNQILDLTELDGKLNRFKPQREDLTSHLKHWVNAFSALAQHRGIELSFHSERQTYFCDFDATKLERAIANLLSNALKFVPPGGVVKVGICSKNDKQLEINLEDNGPGFSPQKLPHLFDRFYTESHSVGSGTGIGLALCKELITLHKGQIRVTSEPGKGTRFRIVLPESQQPSPSSSALSDVEHSDPIPTGTEGAPMILPESEKGTGQQLPTNTEMRNTILILEKDLHYRNFLKSCLKDHFRLLEADISHLGLPKTLDEIPDLVIYRWDSASWGGIDLCNILAQDRRTSHIPQLVIAEREWNRQRVSDWEHGLVDVMVAPFQTQELQARIRNLVVAHQHWRDRVFHELGWSRQQSPIMSEDLTFFQNVLEIVQNHTANEHFGVLELAEKMGMSRRQLHRKIKALTGRKPSELISQIRIHRAARLIKAERGTISEIAYEVGFKNLSHFSKKFKEEYGTAPSEFTALTLDPDGTGTLALKPTSISRPNLPEIKSY